MYKILFVDDDIALRNVVSEYFNERQYDIICTASAAKTIDYLKSTSIDCVILDVDLPYRSYFYPVIRKMTTESKAFFPEGTITSPSPFH